MRLARLDLTRYGHFTDRVLHFPAPAPGAPDLHVIHGDNEAGKTTLHTAVLDLLFGIEHQSDYGFLHPYATMQIGAALDIDGARLEVMRLKRRQNSLLDASGTPLPETVLAGPLGGLTRDEARMMFSLDDATLEDGGESILASRGDLGALLFAASAGLADLSDRLDAVRAEAEAFRRPSGRGMSALKDGRARLEELTARRRALDLQASEHAARREALAAAEAAHGAASAALTQAAAAHEAVRRHAAAWPWLEDLRRQRAALAALDPLPGAPAGWAEEVAALREEAAQLRSLDQTTARAEAEAAAEVARAKAATDPAALALADPIAAAAALQSRAATAQEDLPNRRLALAEARARLAALLADLGRPGAEPGALLLPAAQVARLRGLIEAHGALAAADAAARSELQAARDHRAALQDAGDPPAPAAPAALGATLARLRGADPSAALRTARAALAKAEAALAARLDALRPWAAGPDELARLSPPPAALRARWRADLAAAERAAEATAAEHARLQAEAERLRAAVTGAASGGAAEEGALAALRSRRERAWAAHRARLDPDSADAFEAALRAHDLGMEARLRSGAAEGQRTERAAALATCAAAQATAATAADAAADRLAALRGDLAAALAALGLPADWPAEALDGWLARRDEALAAAQARDAAAADHAAAAQAEAAALAALAAAGVPAGPGGLPAALDTAQALQEAAAEARSHHTALREARAAEARRAEAAAAAADALRGWHIDWADACAGCWLGAGAAPPERDAVRAALERLEALARELPATTALADRIAKMDRDAAAFAEAVAPMAAALSLPPAPPLVQWQTLTARLEAARTAQTAHAQAEARLVRARADRAACQERIAALEARRAPICAHLAVDTLAEAAACLDALARRDALRGALDETAQRLAAAMGVATAAAAEAALEDSDPAAVAAAEQTHAAARDAARAELDTALVARAEAQRALEASGGDDAVARIEAERATVLTELEDGAHRHLRLRFGIAAVEAALASYRDRHRSAMLERASQVFARISRGSYGGLATRPGGGREELIALPAAGGAKEVAKLSKGTRFQLYLALRVAGHAEYARQRPPMPFVADDIMETFDDHRTAAAFVALAEMARAGQVIYLTHHAHLAEIARNAVPEVRLHALT